MPVLRQVPRAEATADIVLNMYDRLFGDRDPVSEPGTATGTPGDWWTVFALAPDILQHAVDGFAVYRHPSRKIDPVLRELGQTRAGWVKSSQFVFSQHCKSLRGLGVSEEMIAAAVRVAKSRSSWVTAHAHGAEGIKIAINAGVDSIEHASLADEEALRLAKARGTWLAMDIYNGTYIDDVGTKEGWPEEYLRKNRETTDAQRAAFRRAVEIGVNIGYATDAGVYPHGLNARQFSNMVKYGMTPMQAIQSATVRASELLGKDDELGSIAPGRFADLVAVDGDPLNDIRILENVAHVMKGGNIVR